MQPIVARPRPILVSAGLVFAGLVFAGLISADPILAGLILAARFIVSPAFARLRFVGPIFGSHVSKDYSRKSRFDKSSKHSFREISVAPAASSGTKCKSHRHHQHRIYIPAPGPQSGPISGTIRGNTVTFSFTYPTNVQGQAHLHRHDQQAGRRVRQLEPDGYAGAEQRDLVAREQGEPRLPALLVVEPAARVLRPRSLAIRTHSGTPGRGQAGRRADRGIHLRRMRPRRP